MMFVTLLITINERIRRYLKWYFNSNITTLLNLDKEYINSFKIRTNITNHFTITRKSVSKIIINQFCHQKNN